MIFGGRSSCSHTLSSAAHASCDVPVVIKVHTAQKKSIPQNFQVPHQSDVKVLLLSQVQCLEISPYLHPCGYSLPSFNYTLRMFYARFTLFCFKRPLPNLRHSIFSLTTFLMGILPLIYARFNLLPLGRKTRPACTVIYA